MGGRGFPGEKGNKRGAILAIFSEFSSVSGKPIHLIKYASVFQAMMAPLVLLVIILLLKEMLGFPGIQVYLDHRDQLGFPDQKDYKVTSSLKKKIEKQFFFTLARLQSHSRIWYFFQV